jgi:hypothetical protein
MMALLAETVIQLGTINTLYTVNMKEILIVVLRRKNNKDKSKDFPVLIKYYAMKTYGGVDV